MAFSPQPSAGSRLTVAKLLIDFWRHNDLIEVKDGRYESTVSRRVKVPLARRFPSPWLV